MAHRNIARVLAPLAIIVALVAIVVVVQASRPDDDSAPSSAITRTTTQSRTTPKKKAKPRSYVVKAGDNLTVIASNTGVSVEKIQQLNPSVDPQALHVGQRIKLSP